MKVAIGFAALTGLIVTGFVSSTVLAETKNEKREARQEKRIEQGVASGELTDKEAAKLEAGQARVDDAQAAANADGTLTKKEKKHLNQMQNKQSKKIHNQKHDEQKKH